MPEGDRALVERNDDVRRLKLGEHGEERVGEAERRADELAGGAHAQGFRQLLHRVEGAVDDRVPVDDDEPRGGLLASHGPIIRREGQGRARPTWRVKLSVS